MVTAARIAEHVAVVNSRTRHQLVMVVKFTNVTLAAEFEIPLGEVQCAEWPTCGVVVCIYLTIYILRLQLLI